VPTRVTVRDLPRLISSQAPLVENGVQHLNGHTIRIALHGHTDISIQHALRTYAVPNNLALDATKAPDSMELALTLASGTLRIMAALVVIMPRGALLGSTEPYSSKRSADEEPPPVAQPVGRNLISSRETEDRA